MSDTEGKGCPVCEVGSSVTVFQSEDYPALLFPVDRPRAWDVPTAPLVVFKCRECDHEFQANHDPILTRAIYEDLYRFYPYDNDGESFQKSYREPFLHAFTNMVADSRNGSVLEIGCGSPEALTDLEINGMEVVGISPEPPECPDPRLRVGFFEDVHLLEQYSFIVSRFNLEHIVDLKSHLAKVSTLLREKGSVLMQVPNVEAFRQNGIDHYFAHEHPQYFCSRSLMTLFVRNGFVIDVAPKSADTSLIIQASKASSSIEGLPKSDDKTALMAMLSSRESNNVIYGAGLNLAGLIYGESGANIRARVVDDNNQYWGRSMPNSSIVIEDPAQVLSSMSAPNVLLLLNGAYHADVARRVRRLNPSSRLFAMKVTGGRQVLAEL